MSSVILKDPGTARPWPPASLRSSPLDDGLRSDTVVESAAGGPEAALVAARGEAAAILQRARQEVSELIQTARQEAEQLRASAFQHGSEEARQEAEQEQERLRLLAHQMGAAYQRFCLAQVPDLAGLATMAAEKLIGDQLALEPERVVAIVRQAMEHVLGSTQVTLHLNPEDVERVQHHLPSDQPGHSPSVQFQSDPAVERGGCWIESQQGQVDATVTGRLSRLQALMRDA